MERAGRRGGGGNWALTMNCRTPKHGCPIPIHATGASNAKPGKLRSGGLSAGSPLPGGRVNWNVLLLHSSSLGSRLTLRLLIYNHEVSRKELNEVFFHDF